MMMGAAVCCAALFFGSLLIASFVSGNGSRLRITTMAGQGKKWKASLLMMMMATTKTATMMMMMAVDKEKRDLVVGTKNPLMISFCTSSVNV